MIGKVNEFENLGIFRMCNEILQKVKNKCHFLQ